MMPQSNGTRPAVVAATFGCFAADFTDGAVLLFDRTEVATMHFAVAVNAEREAVGDVKA